MRVAGASVVLAAAMMLSACSTKTREPAAQPAPSLPAASAMAAGGSVLAVGSTVPVLLLTHCGIESVRINGRWWNALTPLYGPAGEGAGPPAGWGDPFQKGTLTLQSDERAVFEALGQQVLLAPSPTGEPIRICR